MLSIGVQLGVGRVTLRGPRPGSSLIVKIRALSFGAAMLIKRMLSSMSFEELATYPIFSDGSTVIQSVWRPKDRRDL